MTSSWKNLKTFLEEKVYTYNKKSFIETDPIQIPHSFSKKEDVEISAFITSTLSWGNRTSIIKKSKELFSLMDNAPYDFIMGYKETDLKKIQGFVYRTFQPMDLIYFLNSLREIYKKYSSLEDLFKILENEKNPVNAFCRFRKIFFSSSLTNPTRTQKHVSNPEKGSACKRLNMFLRWMVRKDSSGVDLGIWRSIPSSKLSLPLDLHSASCARKIGLLSRKQNDLKAVLEIDEKLRFFDSEDPAKFDFALFGLEALKNKDLES